MRLLTLGLNHKTASVALREQISINDVSQADALEQFGRELGCSEVAILSTCNRTEFYVVSQHLTEQQVLKWIASHQKIDLQQLASSTYHYWDEEAVQHVMRVACGLDSLVLGEPQILGQLKSSYSSAKSQNSLGSYLERFFQEAFSVAKAVRTETDIGVNPVSVAFTAVNLSKHIFTDLTKTSALIIGAGETAELLATHLRQSGVERLLVANRTLSRAQLLADRFDGEAYSLRQLPETLDQVDIVVSSTASELPVLGKGVVEAAIKRRKHRPILMLDLAVPRDIEPEVGDLQDIYLYSVDDLQEVVDENRQQRMKAAEEAELIIQKRTRDFMQQLKELDAVATLTCFRRHVELIRESELQAAQARIQRGEDPADVMARMSRSLINKLMHEPTLQIRKAGGTGHFELLDSVQMLFGLELQGDDLKAPGDDNVKTMKPKGTDEQDSQQSSSSNSRSSSEPQEKSRGPSPET